MNRLPVEALTAAAFAPFGDVIECSDRAQRMRVNQGFAERYHDLATIDMATGGRPLISIFRTRPRALPLHLSLMERHPLGSQAFVPMAAVPYLVVVAPEDRALHGAPDMARVRCFAAGVGQGINYARGVWHHPLLSLESDCDFLVVDRGGAGINLEEYSLPSEVFLVNWPA